MRTPKAFGFRDQLGYMLGDFANGLFFSLTASYLTLFYVDIIGISAASVGTLLVVARCWDAINDPMIGGWIDRLKPSSDGKFKPWILRMAVPVVIFGMLSFTAIPSLLVAPMHVKLMYTYITYIGFGMSYTAINIPYGSMASVITDDEVERTTLSMFRSYGAVAASLFLNMIIPLLVFDENRVPQAKGFINVVIVLGILAVISYILCYKLSTERIQPVYTPSSKGDFIKTLKGIAMNKPLIIQMIAGMLSIGVFLISGTLAPYLFKDYFKNTQALVFNGLLAIGSMVIVSVFLKNLVARFGKKEVAIFGILLYAVCSFLFFLLPITNVYVYLTLMGIGICGLTCNTLLMWAFIPDCIDYQEYITHKREEGTIYAIYSFARKMGQAGAGLIGAYILIWVGYVAGQPEQSMETSLNIKRYVSLIPALCMLILGALLMFGYDLDKNKLIMIKEALRKRRETN